MKKSFQLLILKCASLLSLSLDYQSSVIGNSFPFIYSSLCLKLQAESCSSSQLSIFPACRVHSGVPLRLRLSFGPGQLWFCLEEVETQPENSNVPTLSSGS